MHPDPLRILLLHLSILGGLALSTSSGAQETNAPPSWQIAGALTALYDHHTSVQAIAIDQLQSRLESHPGYPGDEQAILAEINQVFSGLDHDAPMIRYASLKLIAAFTNQPRTRILRIAEMVNDESDAVAAVAISTLAPIANKQHALYFKEALESSNPKMRREALIGLRRIGITDNWDLENITALLKDDDDEIKELAMKILADRKHLARRAADALVPFLKNPQSRLFPLAVETLRAMGATSDPKIDEMIRTARVPAPSSNPLEGLLLTLSDQPFTLPQLESSAQDETWIQRLDTLRENGASGLGDILELLDACHGYEVDTAALRFLAYYINRGEKINLPIIRRLGRSAEPFDATAKSFAGIPTHEMLLRAMRVINESPDAYTDLRKEIARQLAVLASQGAWSKEREDLLQLTRMYKALDAHPDTQLLGQLVRYTIQGKVKK